MALGRVLSRCFGADASDDERRSIRRNARTRRGVAREANLDLVDVFHACSSRVRLRRGDPERPNTFANSGAAVNARLLDSSVFDRSFAFAQMDCSQISSQEGMWRGPLASVRVRGSYRVAEIGERRLPSSYHGKHRGRQKG